MRKILIATAMLVALAAGEAPAQRLSPARTAPAARPSAPARVAPVDIETQRRQAARRVEAADRTGSDGRATDPAQRAFVAMTYERDRFGRWRRRGEIVLVSEDPAAGAAARGLGLTEVRRAPLPAAGLTLFTFAVPPGMQTDDAFAALKAARPDDAVDLNYVYEFDGHPGWPRATSLQGPAAPGGGRRIAAMIDASLPPNAAVLAGVSVRSVRFGPDAGHASAHALAVAAVLADTAGRDGLTLLAIDVSEPGALAGASTSSIVQALDWAAGQDARVINVSLTGPANAAVAAVVRRVAARGVVIVAAAGNGGPHAEPPYPAALPQVVGVTAVDGRLRIWRRATQGPHVDFAARGVKVSAAGAEWTGTSFAAPVVAGLMLRLGIGPEGLTTVARDLGEPGRDPVFGAGFLSEVWPGRVAQAARP